MSTIKSGDEITITHWDHPNKGQTALVLWAGSVDAVISLNSGGKNQTIPLDYIERVERTAPAPVAAPAAEVTVDPITFTLDNSRYGSRLEAAFDVPFIVPGSVVMLDCPDCGTQTTYNPAKDCFDRCNCADSELMPVDVATDLPWFVTENGILAMGEVVYGECRNTDWENSDGMECGNDLTRYDAAHGNAECWACRHADVERATIEGSHTAA